MSEPYDLVTERAAQKERLENPGMGTLTIEAALSRAHVALEAARQENRRLREALEAIEHPDELVQANEDAFSVHALRYVKSVARAALHPDTSQEGGAPWMICAAH